ncbi:MAG TPA: tyrosinase family protein [Stellaceae bacterium]|jgi:tyrosinase|nr:tyrosinase family protein [Stellaceae bacterium]
MAIRQNIANLSAADLATWRQVMTASKGLLDNRGYIHFAGMHGLPNQFCQHGTPLFLPWHRAYLYMLEMAMRDINSAVALPWWDWTSDDAHTNGLPAAYTDASVAGNPLLSGETGLPQRTLQRIQAQVPDSLDFSVNPPLTVRAPGPPDELPSAATIEAILGAPTFADFTSQLEDQHNQVHGWVGGSMGIVPIAAFDPIFFAHHTMIDRLWYLWQLRNPNGGVGTVPLDQALQGTPLTVRQVLDINQLGYDYATKVTTG